MLNTETMKVKDPFSIQRESELCVIDHITQKPTQKLLAFTVKHSAHY